ncbi:hypothetical protein ACVJBD_007551 [Rhizobium mongolense]
MIPATVGGAEIDAFEKAIEPCRSHRIARIEAIQEELFGLDISFEEFEARYTSRLLDIMDGEGNFGKKSVGLKSYLLPDIGLIRPLYDRTLASNSWRELRKTYTDRPKMNREDAANVTKDLCRYTFTLTLEECLKRDLPMQIHTGDGEAPYIQRSTALRRRSRTRFSGSRRVPRQTVTIVSRHVV